MFTSCVDTRRHTPSQNEQSDSNNGTNHRRPSTSRLALSRAFCPKGHDDPINETNGVTRETNCPPNVRRTDKGTVSPDEGAASLETVRLDALQGCTLAGIGGRHLSSVNAADLPGVNRSVRATMLSAHRLSNR
jgi:hypothetical protein